VPRRSPGLRLKPARALWFGGGCRTLERAAIGERQQRDEGEGRDEHAQPAVRRRRARDDDATEVRLTHEDSGDGRRLRRTSHCK
jgi:hypothetical protein